jgi:hypothetical protein
MLLVEIEKVWQVVSVIQLYPKVKLESHCTKRECQKWRWRMTTLTTKKKNRLQLTQALSRGKRLTRRSYLDQVLQLPLSLDRQYSTRQSPLRVTSMIE